MELDCWNQFSNFFSVSWHHYLHYAYVDFEALFRINNAGAFFVTRAKKVMRYNVIEENFNIDQSIGLRSDKTIWGHSENAVKINLWVAICSHLIVAYVKHLTKSPLSIYEVMLVLNNSLFEKTPLTQLLNVNEKIQTDKNQDVKEQLLFNIISVKTN